MANEKKNTFLTNNILSSVYGFFFHMIFRKVNRLINISCSQYIEHEMVLRMHLRTRYEHDGFK